MVLSKSKEVQASDIALNVLLLTRFVRPLEGLLDR